MKKGVISANCQNESRKAKPKALDSLGRLFAITGIAPSRKRQAKANRTPIFGLGSNIALAHCIGASAIFFIAKYISIFLLH